VFIKKRGLCKACYVNWWKKDGPKRTGLTAKRVAKLEATKDLLQSKADAARLNAEVTRLKIDQANVIASSYYSRMQAGETVLEIAETEGVLRQTIAARLKRAGLPTYVYKRVNKAANVSPRMRAVVRILASLDQNIAYGAKDECWLWTGTTMDPSAGRAKDYRLPVISAFDPLDASTARKTTAYRVVFMLYKGPIPEGMTVDHICWNPLCCNPDHLQLLTVAENSARKDPAKIEARRLKAQEQSA
jgi:hypothetical protein